MDEIRTGKKNELSTFSFAKPFCEKKIGLRQHFLDGAVASIESFISDVT